MNLQSIRNLVRPYIPAPARSWIRRQELRVHYPPEFRRFMAASTSPTEARQRREICERFARAHIALDCRHTHAEILTVADAILAATGKGVIVEAGCFKGGSTAKLSVAAKLTGRKLVIFDSFEGLPNPGPAETRKFQRGEYAGALDEVRENVRKYGEISACDFVKGWFSDTMHSFHEPVCVAFVDVDLSDSLRTCIIELYPRLNPGGSFFSHDGHLPSCIALLRDETFWRSEVGVAPPPIPGLGMQKFLRIQKPM